jgi:hypothetical protein
MRHFTAWIQETLVRKLQGIQNDWADGADGADEAELLSFFFGFVSMPFFQFSEAGINTRLFKIIRIARFLRQMQLLDGLQQLAPECVGLGLGAVQLQALPQC